MFSISSPAKFIQELVHFESEEAAVASLTANFPPDEVSRLLSPASRETMETGARSEYCTLFALVSRLCYSDEYFSIVFPTLFDLLLELLRKPLASHVSEVLDLLHASWNVLKHYEVPDSLFQPSAYRPLASVCETRDIMEILRILCDFICANAPISKADRARPLRDRGENPDNCAAAAANLLVELLVQPELRYSTSLRALAVCGSAAFASFGDIRHCSDPAVGREARAHLSILHLLSLYSPRSLLISEALGELLSFSPLVGHASRPPYAFTPIPTVPEHVHYYPYLNSLCLGCLEADASGPEEEEFVAGMSTASFAVILNCIDALCLVFQHSWVHYNCGRISQANQCSDRHVTKRAHLSPKKETFDCFISWICQRFIPLLSRLSFVLIIHLARGRSGDPMTEKFLENEEVRQAISDVRYRYFPTELTAISIGGFYPQEVEAAQIICTGPGSLSELSQFPFLSPFSTLSSKDCACNRIAAELGAGADAAGDSGPPGLSGIYVFPVSRDALGHLCPPLSGGGQDGPECDVLQLAMELFIRLMRSVSPPSGEAGEARHRPAPDPSEEHAALLRVPSLGQAHLAPPRGADSPLLSFRQPACALDEPATPPHSRTSSEQLSSAIPHSAEQTAESTVSSDLGISLMSFMDRADGAHAAPDPGYSGTHRMPPVALTLFRFMGGEFTALSADMLSERATDKSVYERYAPFLLNSAVLSFVCAVFVQSIVSHFKDAQPAQRAHKRLCPASCSNQRYLEFLGVLSQARPAVHQLRVYLELGSSLSHNLMLLMERKKLHKSAHEQAAFTENKDHLCIADQMPKPGFFSPAPRIPGELYTLPDLRTAFRKTGQGADPAGGAPEPGDEAAEGASLADLDSVVRQFTGSVMCILGLPASERPGAGAADGVGGRGAGARPQDLRDLVVSALSADQRVVIGLTNAELSSKWTTTLLRHWDFQDHEHLLFSSLAVYYLNLYSLSTDAYQMLQDDVQFTRRTEPDLASHVTRPGGPGGPAGPAGRRGRQPAPPGRAGGPQDGSQRDSQCSTSESASGCVSTFTDEDKPGEAGRAALEANPGAAPEANDEPSGDSGAYFESSLFFRLCEATPTACMLAAPRQLENSQFSLRHYGTLLYAPPQHGVERMEFGARVARAALGSCSPLSAALERVTGSRVYPTLPSVLYLPCIRTSAYRESVLDIISQRPGRMGVRFGDVHMAMSYDILLASERVWGCDLPEVGTGPLPAEEGDPGGPDSEVINPLLIAVARERLPPDLARRVAAREDAARRAGSGGQGCLPGKDCADAPAAPGQAPSQQGSALQREARNSSNLRLLLGNLYSDDFLSVRKASSLTAVAALPALSRELPTVSPYKIFSVMPILAGTVDTYAKALTASAEVGVWDEGAFLDLLTFMQPKLVRTFSQLHAATTCRSEPGEGGCAHRRAVIDLNDAFTPDATAPGGYRLTAADLQQRVFHSASRAEIHQTMPPMEPGKLMAAQFLTSVSFILHSKPAYMYNDPMMSLLSFLLRTLGHFPALHEVEDIVDVLPTLILISRCITLMPTTELAIYLAFFGSGGTKPVSSEGRRVFAEAVADILFPGAGGAGGMGNGDSSAAAAERSPADPPAFPFDVEIIPSVPGEQTVVDESGEERRVPGPISASTLLPTDRHCFLDPNTQRVTVYSTESCVFYSLPLRTFLAARWYFRALLSAQVMLVVLLRGMDGTTMLGSILQGSLATGPKHRRTYLTRLFLLAFSVYSQACVSQLGLLYPPELPRGAPGGAAGAGGPTVPTGPAGPAGPRGSGRGSADRLSTDAIRLTADPWEFARRFRDLIIGPLGGIVSGIIADTLSDRIRSGTRRTRISPATALAYRCLDMQNLSLLTGELAGKYLFYQSSGYIDPRLFGLTPASYTLIRPFNCIVAAYLMSNQGFSLEKGEAHLTALRATLPPPFLRLVEEIGQNLGRVHEELLVADPEAPDQSFQEFHFFVSLDQIVASWLLCGGLEEIEERERAGQQGGLPQGPYAEDGLSAGMSFSAAGGHPLPTRHDMENLANMFCLVRAKYLLQ